MFHEPANNNGGDKKLCSYVHRAMQPSKKGRMLMENTTFHDCKVNVVLRSTNKLLAQIPASKVVLVQAAEYFENAIRGRSSTINVLVDNEAIAQHVRTCVTFAYLGTDALDAAAATPQYWAQLFKMANYLGMQSCVDAVVRKATAVALGGSITNIIEAVTCVKDIETTAADDLVQAFASAVQPALGDVPTVLNSNRLHSEFMQLPFRLLLALIPLFTADNENSVVSLLSCWVDANNPSLDDRMLLAKRLRWSRTSPTYLATVVPALAWLWPPLNPPIFGTLLLGHVRKPRPASKSFVVDLKLLPTQTQTDVQQTFAGGYVWQFGLERRKSVLVLSMVAQLPMRTTTEASTAAEGSATLGPAWGIAYNVSVVGPAVATAVYDTPQAAEGSVNVTANKRLVPIKGVNTPVKSEYLVDGVVHLQVHVLEYH